MCYLSLCDLVAPYDNNYLGEHGYGQWFLNYLAWRQDITWNKALPINKDITGWDNGLSAVLLSISHREQTIVLFESKQCDYYSAKLNLKFNLQNGGEFSFDPNV